MKLGEDVLVAIIEALRRGLVDGVDISDTLRGITLVASPDGSKVNLERPVGDSEWTWPATD